MTGNTTRVGSMAWTNRTGGTLSGAEKRQLLAPLARAHAVNAVGRTAMALRVHSGRRAQVPERARRTPPSALTRTAEQVALQRLTPAVLNHSYRCYSYSVAIAALEDIDVDRELLSAAAMLPDTGRQRLHRAVKRRTSPTSGAAARPPGIPWGASASRRRPVSVATSTISSAPRLGRSASWQSLGDFLEHPAVTVGVVERRVRGVAAVVRIGSERPRLGAGSEGAAFGVVEDLAHRGTALHHVGPGRLDVGDDEVQASGQARCGRRRQARAEVDRAHRTRRCHLDDAEVIVECEVGVLPPVQRSVELLRAIDVGDGDADDFELGVHGLAPSLRRGSWHRAAPTRSPWR